MQEIKQADYPRRRHLKYLPTSLLVVWLLFAVSLRAQDNPLNDPDLKTMLKEAQKMQKEASEPQSQNPTSPDTKKKLAEMLSQAREEEARQEEQEKREREKLQAGLKKQLEAPGRSCCLDTGDPRIQGRWFASTKNRG